MGNVKAWLAVAVVGLILGCGGIFALVSSQGSKPSQPAASTSARLPNGAKTLTPQDANQMVQGLLAQVQAAANTATGPKAITTAEAKAILDEQQKKLGITTGNP